MGFFLYKTRIGAKFLDFFYVAGRNADAEYRAENCIPKYFTCFSSNRSLANILIATKKKHCSELTAMLDEAISFLRLIFEHCRLTFR